MKTKEQVKDWLADKYVDTTNQAALLNGWLMCKYNDTTSWAIRTYATIDSHAFHRVYLDDLIAFVNSGGILKESKAELNIADLLKKPAQLIKVPGPISLMDVVEGVNKLYTEVQELKEQIKK